MIILLSARLKRNYIVGIFKDQQKALQYFDKLDEHFEMRSTQLNFPFKIIETYNDDGTNTFSFHNNFVANYDYICYTIDKEYIPKEFGCDEMGALNHQHFEFE